MFTPTSKKLSESQKWLFGTGDLSTSLTLAIQTFFQLYFLTDVAKIAPSMAAWVIGITRLWDAVNDPIVGIISDRIKSRFGRRRVLLLFGSFPLGFAFAVCWLVPAWSQFQLACYYTVAIIAFDTTFTIVHVGYNSLTPNMTADYDERSSLNGVRMVYSLGGTLAAILFATMLSEYFNEQKRFLILGLTLGTIATVPPWIVSAISRNADQSETPNSLPLRDALLATFGNRAFLMLTGIFLTSWTATCVMAAMLIYFANYCLKVPSQANYFLVVAQGSAVASVPLIIWLARRFDKPKAFVMGTVFWCFVLSGFFFISDESVHLAYVAAMLCGPGIATSAVIPWSMLPDVIEFEQKQNGQRREGTYYAFVSFFQKLGTGIALWAIGLALSHSGYITPESTVSDVIQPDSVTQMVRLIIGPITISLLLMSLPFAWLYPIDRIGHNQTVKELRGR